MFNGDGEHISTTDTTRWLQKHGVAAVYFGLVLVIIIELIPQANIVVSWKLIALFTLLLVTPFIGNLKRIWVSNIGGVELESDIESTQSLVSKFLADSPDITTSHSKSGHESSDSRYAGEESGRGSGGTPPDEYIDDLGGTPQEISDELYGLLESDPRLALAKLRMEMEETVDSFLKTMGYQGPMTHQDRYRIMSDIDDLDMEVVRTHKEIRDLCNKAIHGEDIRMQDAIEIVDMGIDFLAGMKSRELYERFKRGEEIDEEELDAILGQSSDLLSDE